MAVLSKMVIESIASKMTEKSRKHVDALKKEYQELVTQIYEQQIPEEIKKIFKTHSEYIRTTTSVYMNGYGLSGEHCSLTKSLPSVAQYNTDMKLTAVITDKIVKAQIKWEKAQKEYKTLVNETESALYALKTSKNIRENLPEAIPYLPPPMSNSLVVNFASLQKKLNKQPDIKKEVAVS